MCALALCRIRSVQEELCGQQTVTVNWGGEGWVNCVGSCSASLAGLRPQPDPQSPRACSATIHVVKWGGHLDVFTRLKCQAH